jgi:hypothetical protein
LRAFDAATHKVALTALAFARPPMFGLWTIVAACRALADSLSGIAVDLRTLRLKWMGTSRVGAECASWRAVMPLTAGGA